MGDPLPRNTKSDIENNESISIVGWVQNTQQFDEGDEKYYLQGASGESIELKVWPEETDLYDIEQGQWYIFENAEGDVWQGDRKLSSNRGDMEVFPLENPPEFADKPTESIVGENALSEGGLLAVDIETVSTVPEVDLDLDDSDHLELLCIGVGYAPEPNVPGRSDVLFRTGTTPETEADLLERFYEFVDVRDPEQLVLFKGDFDIQHLRGRAERVPDSGIKTHIDELFDECAVVNLTPPGSLEENLEQPIKTYWDIYRHSLDPEEWREDHPKYSGAIDSSVVTNKDISHFGDRYLELCETDKGSREHRALHQLIKHYTLADIDPLFDLVGTGNQ